MNDRDSGSMKHVRFYSCKSWGLPLYHEERLIANTKLLIEKARKSGSPVFYIMYTEPAGPRSAGQALWQIIERIADSFLETNLNMLLKNQVVEGLVICGIQTEYCVDTTVRSARCDS